MQTNFGKNVEKITKQVKEVFSVTCKRQNMKFSRKTCDFVLQDVWAIFETNFEKNMGENVRKMKDVFSFDNEKCASKLNVFSCS